MNSNAVGRPQEKIAFQHLLFRPGVFWQSNVVVNFESAVRQFLAQNWAFFVKPNQKKMMFVNIFWWNFESKIKRKWNFSELSIEVWRLDIPKNWFGIEIYRYFHRYICKNVPKSCIFSFNLSKIKNLETSEDFFGVQNWFLYPKKTKSRVSDDFSQNIKTVSTGGRRKEASKFSSYFLPVD